MISVDDFVRAEQTSVVTRPAAKTGKTGENNYFVAEVVRRQRIDRMLAIMDEIFGEPPPDGYEDWNDWMEDGWNDPR